jgi:hypothetical protein
MTWGRYAAPCSACRRNPAATTATATQNPRTRNFVRRPVTNAAIDLDRVRAPRSPAGARVSPTRAVMTPPLGRRNGAATAVSQRGGQGRSAPLATCSCLEIWDGSWCYGYDRARRGDERERTCRLPPAQPPRPRAPGHQVGRLAAPDVQPGLLVDAGQPGLIRATGDFGAPRRPGCPAGEHLPDVNGVDAEARKTSDCHCLISFRVRL